jgi:hypothetical protein
MISATLHIPNEKLTIEIPPDLLSVVRYTIQSYEDDKKFDALFQKPAVQDKTKELFSSLRSVWF